MLKQGASKLCQRHRASTGADIVTWLQTDINCSKHTGGGLSAGGGGSGGGGEEHSSGGGADGAAQILADFQDTQTQSVPTMDPERISILKLGQLQKQGSAYVVARAEG